MSSLPFSPEYQTALLAVGRRPRAEQWGRSVISWSIPFAFLDREHAANGNEGRLLADLRRIDPPLYDHSLLVWALTKHLAASLGYPEEEQATIAAAALMHDVGKLTLPMALLDKPARLTPQEYAVMQQHCAVGAYLLQQMHTDDRVIELVYHHHERWDGQGYPTGLAGLTIPTGARLIAIADALGVMTTPRPYQQARPISAAIQELERCAGTQFDPLLVQQCSASLRSSIPFFWQRGASLTRLLWRLRTSWLARRKSQEDVPLRPVHPSAMANGETASDRHLCQDLLQPSLSS
ncbi:MAG: HD-GYP domain-containing protein [Ktedonobacteraceae bacterium]